jgi:hypothetical protein
MRSGWPLKVPGQVPGRVGPAVHERLEHLKAGPVRDRAHDGRIKQSR